MKTKAKRTWNKPIVQDEQAGMEVTSYASATLQKAAGPIVTR